MDTMTETHDFPLGVVLSITTGRLLCDIGQVYEILGFMVGDDDTLMTHQLPRVGRECEQPLLDQHPDLAGIVVPEDMNSEEKVGAWLASIAGQYGTSRPVARLAPEDHTSIGPLTELALLRPDLTVIPVVIEDDDAD